MDLCAVDAVEVHNVLCADARVVLGNAVQVVAAFDCVDGVVSACCC